MKAAFHLGGALVSKSLRDQRYEFRDNKKGRDDSRPVWWKDQSSMVWRTGDVREWEQGTLGFTIY